MRKYRVCLTRDTSEEASIVVEANSRAEAAGVVYRPDLLSDLRWEEGSWAGKSEVVEVDEVEASEPLGSYLSETAAKEAHAKELFDALKACHDVLLMDPNARHGSARLYAQVVLDKIDHAQGKNAVGASEQAVSIDSRASK